MYQVSDDFKKIIYDSGRELLAKIEADLSNGTHLTLNVYDLMENGFEIEDAVSESGKFQVGAVIINQLTLILNNFKDKSQGNNLDGYDFTGAVLRPYVGLVVKKDWHGDIVEWVPKGVFTAEKPMVAGSRITVTALDNMAKLDTVYSKSTLKYPATLGQIAADACSVCGVALAMTTFPNSTYSVAKRPDKDSITCREILSYVAQLAGCFALCNTDGAVDIRWYEGSDTLYDVGAGASSSSVADTDTIVTGVQIQGSDGAVYSSGIGGYIVRIQDNPLAQDGVQAITDALGAKFNGYAFRAYTVSSPSNPAIEAGDVVNMTDSKGVTHKTIVSRLIYSIDGAEEYNADAETAEENKSERFTAAQKAQEKAEQAQETANEAYSRTGEIEQEFKAADGQLISRITDTENNLQSQITQNEREINTKVSNNEFESEIDQLSNKIKHKVSSGEVSSIIEQSSQEVKIAFNTIAGQYQVVKTDGEKLSFYKGSTHIGDIGVNNNSLVFNLVDGYAMAWQCRGSGNLSWYPTSKDGVKAGFHIGGNAYVDGDIHANGKIEADNIQKGYSGNVGITMSSGDKRTLRFEDGILVDNNY